MPEVPSSPVQGQEPTRPDGASPIPPATYTRLSSLCAGQCWLCGLNGRHASQVVTARDDTLLSEFQRRGVIQLPDLNAFENLVFLCPACHHAFNDPINAWIFVPASLDTLIAAEEAFQTRRQSSAAKGETLPRPPAAAADASMLFSRYQIRPRYLFAHVFTENPTRAWPGSPLAAIIRSARILVPGLERLPVEKGGIPIDVALKLQRLLLLFGTPDPRLGVQPETAPGPVGGGSPGSQIVLQVRRGPTRPARANPIPRGSASFNTGEGIPGPSTDYSQDFSAIGRAFNTSLQYIGDRLSERNLSAEAHAWITAEIPLIMLALRKELSLLHANRDNTSMLPEYAINRKAPLMVYTSPLPYVIVRYNPQFMAILAKLMKACDLDDTDIRPSMASPALVISITFPPRGAQSESHTLGNRLFDPGFESEFVGAIEALTSEPEIDRCG